MNIYIGCVTVEYQPHRETRRSLLELVTKGTYLFSGGAAVTVTEGRVTSRTRGGKYFFPHKGMTG